MASQSNSNTVPCQLDIDGKRYDNYPNFDVHFPKAKFLKEGFNQRYRTFAMFSTMHGYLEIQMTTSIVFKVLWALIIGVGLGFTFYQVYQATNQYVNQSTTTTIEQVKKQDLRYPPLYLCSNHWIQWLDWHKAFQLNYTKEALFYGFSCGSNVYCSEHFDIQRATEEFEAAQKTNNISTYDDFFRLVAKSVDKFINYIYSDEFDENGRISGSDLFTEVEIADNQFCYKATSEKIKREMEKSKPLDLSKSNMLAMTLNTSTFRNDMLTYLTINEYANYILEWLSKGMEHYTLKNTGETAVPKNYLNVGMPLWLVVNGYGDSVIEVYPQVDKYKITVKALVNNWLNKPDKPCVKGATYIFPDPTCFKDCKSKIRLHIFGNESLNIDKPGNTQNKTCCTGSIEFLEVAQAHSVQTVDGVHNNENRTENSTTNSKLLNVTQWFPKDADVQTKDNRTDNATAVRKAFGLECSEHIDNETMGQLINESAKCENICNPLKGCETWRYEINVATSAMYSMFENLADKTSTTLIISYPSDGETLVVVETDKQSWDNFVGNVGGIVGVWTGASILSFIQIFYLCICAPPAA